MQVPKKQQNKGHILKDAKKKKKHDRKKQTKNARVARHSQKITLKVQSHKLLKIVKKYLHLKKNLLQ